MKTLAIAVGSILTTVAATASADIYVGRTYYPDRYYSGPLTSAHECWNPRAGHFERVRPGEYQGDLDFRNCRVMGDAYYDTRTYRDVRQECWNPRARHFEELRPGEFQDDLDRSRCRMISTERYAYAAPPYWWR